MMNLLRLMSDLTRIRATEAPGLWWSVTLLQGVVILLTAPLAFSFLARLL